MVSLEIKIFDEIALHYDVAEFPRRFRFPQRKKSQRFLKAKQFAHHCKQAIHNETI